MLEAAMKSAVDTAHNPFNLEFVLSIDASDHSYDDLTFDFVPCTVMVVRDDGKNLSERFVHKAASGPYYMMCADDVAFRTKDWDRMVLSEFSKVPDKILLVYGRDGDRSHDNKHGTHPFIHKNWISATGRYLPPYFSGDFCDTWLNDLADGVGRKIMIDAYIEHLHPAFGKRPQDETDTVKWEKHFKDDMPRRYFETQPEREEDIKKLQAFIDSYGH